MMRKPLGTGASVITKMKPTSAQIAMSDAPKPYQVFGYNKPSAVTGSVCCVSVLILPTTHM